MAITVKFDDKIRELIGGARNMEVTSNTVHQALFQVAREYPALHMFNCDGDLRSILRFTKNGQPAKVTDELADGDEVLLSVST